MIYKLLGWIILIYFIIYKLNIEKKKNKENYKNKELKNHGVGTFPVFNTQTIPPKDDNEEDYSYLDKNEVQNEIIKLKEERENKFNEYLALKQSGNGGEYTNNLENVINILDINISKFQNIYYKISIKDHKTISNELPEYSKDNDEVLFKFPIGNLLPISDNRNIFENRIQSFNTDIEIKNKTKTINELDNKVFEDEFKKIIDDVEVKYYKQLLDYGNIYDDQDYDTVRTLDTKIEEQGLLRKKEYEFVTKNDIKLFNNILDKILTYINKNKNLEVNNSSGLINVNNFVIVQKRVNFILYNKKNENELVFDGELVIYRNMKNHGKHIGFKALYKNNNIYILDLYIKGIVTEDKIYMFIGSNEFENNLVYYEYKNKYVITDNPREKEVANMSFRDKIFLMRDRRNALRLDRGLR
jgi:hypothetical protein